MMILISEKTIERLILYRSLLQQANHEKESGIYSHQLGRMAGFTPAQVRRDLMQVGYTGSPARGYDKVKLIQSISALVDPAEKREIALAGIGSIGRAILAYFHSRSSLMEITAAFDTDPEKTDRVIHGCRCHPVDRLADIVRGRGIRTGILCVPAGAAQSVTDAFVESGVRGILNYAPTRLIVPADVYVENRDMIMAVEKVVYFSGLKTGQRKENG